MISVITVTYNNYNDLHRTLHSLKNVKGIESVVVNGGDCSKTKKLLSNYDFTFDICARADQLPIIIELIDSCPNVQFILDHCGVPDIKNGFYSPWAEQMKDVAKRPNVIAKISGVIAYGDADSWALSDIKPYFDHTVDVFGVERIIWGSDSPVCNLGGGLATWVALTHNLTAEWSKYERNCFYSENAKKLWTIEGI